MKWEYRTELVRIRKRIGLGGRSCVETADVDESLNKLGPEGWELVSAVESFDLGGKPTGVLLLFKRPKA